jgi:flavin-dependent dehydrogenase
MTAEVVILGAGPAGAAAALNLATLRRVTIIDQYGEPPYRIGESLPGAARRLLADMGLWPAFLTAGHLPRYCLRSAWGSAAPVDRDSLFDPDGHGWQIDRVRFEGQLRGEAVARGARLLAPARLRQIARTPNGWRVSILMDGIEHVVDAALLIDATGRASRRLTPFGARRLFTDRLCCAWLRGPNALLPAGLVQIEAEADGWWYAANAPGAAILAFHTDADLPAAACGRTTNSLLAAARRLPFLGGQISASDWSRADHRISAAHGAVLEPVAGDAWIAVGDAAFAVDPLGSTGLFNALYFGLAGAQTAERMFAADPSAAVEYAHDLQRIRDLYTMNLTSFYRLEQRWAERPFWRRRHGNPTAALSRILSAATT